MPNRIDLSGRRFGRLVAMRVHSAQDGNVRWECLCDCGGTCYPTRHNLQAGNHHSCGCLRREIASMKTLTHGESPRSGSSREYNSWSGAKSRCFCPTSQKYPSYGGRGITMCAEWRDSFESFLRDMGRRPIGMSLDRINVNGHYEPSNCRWATDLEQGRNTTRTLRREARLQG